MVCDVTPAFCDEVYFSHGQTCGVPVMDCGNPDDRRITFRIADAHCGIRLFLCLPMLFMHEYACHVYCDDDGFAPIFNEGWLFHASCRYMKRHWATGKWHELLRHHVEAHEQQWEQRNLLKWPDSVGWFLARRLLDSLKDSRAFNAVTRDLASTSGTRRAQRDWHSRWLFGLNDEFDRDPQKILRRMYVTTSGTDSWNRGGFLS